MHQDTVPYFFSAAVAAVAQALMYANSIEKGKVFSWREFFCAVLLSGFVGFLICMGGHAYGLNYELCGALSGLGGLTGKEGISFLFNFVRNRSGVQ